MRKYRIVELNNGTFELQVEKTTARTLFRAPKEYWHTLGIFSSEDKARARRDSRIKQEQEAQCAAEKAAWGAQVKRVVE